MVQVITDKTREIVGAHWCVTRLMSDEDGAHTISGLFLSDEYADYRDGEQEQEHDGSGICAQICEMNRVICISENERKTDLRWQGFRKATKYPPIRGWLAAPLTAGNGNCFGLIQFSDKCEGEFTEFQIPKAGGGDLPVEVRAVEIEWEGRPACLAVLRDLTRQRQMEAESDKWRTVLRKRAEELEQSRLAALNMVTVHRAAR